MHLFLRMYIKKSNIKVKVNMLISKYALKVKRINITSIKICFSISVVLICFTNYNRCHFLKETALSKVKFALILFLLVQGFYIKSIISELFISNIVNYFYSFSRENEIQTMY